MVRTTVGADDEGTPVECLAAIAGATSEITRTEAAEVRRARLAGLSWAEIGLVSA